mgnify:FL=1
MKDDQLPDCYVQANDDYYVCYVIEYDDEEHMDIDEKYLDNGLLEVTKRCRICGQCDVYYPV